MKLSGRNLIGILIGICSLVLMSTQTVHAAPGTPTIRIWDGIGDINTNSIIIADGSSLDTSPLISNVVTYSGSYGVFNVIVSSGVQSGTSLYPELGLNTFEVSGGAGTLYAWFSNTGFGTTPTPAGFDMSGSLSSITGSGSVTFDSYIDNSNTLFGEGTLLASLGSYTSTNSGTTSGTVSLSNPYSLTTKTTVNLTAGSNMQTTTNVAIVPEPVSTTLFIVGGATLGFRRFRKRFKK